MSIGKYAILQENREADPHNNVGRHCNVVGIHDKHIYEWLVIEYVKDVGGNTTYRLQNIYTGAMMRCSMENLTNLV